jgi:phage major head subunit gpT-like protein
MAGSFLPSSVDALNNTVKVGWRESFNRARETAQYQGLITDLGKSQTLKTSIDWLGETGDMEEVTRETARFSGVARFSYTITQKEWQYGLRVRIMDLEAGDIQGQIKARLAGVARRLTTHPGRLAIDQLEANPLAYDGTALFANTRAFGSAANFDNLLAGSGVTAADIEQDIQIASTVMAQAEDDKGEPMELAMNTLVIPRGLALEFAKVLGPVRDAGGSATQMGVIDPSQGNVFKAGGYTVYIVDRLTDANNWYGLHVGEEVNPFVLTWTRMPAPLNTPSLNDDSAVHRKELLYDFYGIYNVGVSLPQYFVSVVN